jgi:hypothetical protein
VFLGDTTICTRVCAKKQPLIYNERIFLDGYSSDGWGSPYR